MNETLKIIAERYSCRAFTERVPADDLLDAVAQAAIAAPSAMNRQNWRIIMVKDTQLIDEMDAEGMRALSLMEDKSSYERMLSRGGKLFYGARRMAVVSIPSKPGNYGLIDCGIAAQNIVLAASSLGLASLHCGMIRHSFAGEKAAEFMTRLKFPEGYECGIAVLLGYEAVAGSPHLPDRDKIIVID